MIYIGGFGLSIPAVTRVVSHLVVHVLTETHFIFGQSHINQIQVDSPNEVTQHWIVDHSLQKTEIRFKHITVITLTTKIWQWLRLQAAHCAHNTHSKNVITYTCSTASPSLMICADCPLVWALDENNMISRLATLENLGWTFSVGSTKCSISAMVNSLHEGDLF